MRCLLGLEVGLELLVGGLRVGWTDVPFYWNQSIHPMAPCLRFRGSFSFYFFSVETIDCCQCLMGSHIVFVSKTHIFHLSFDGIGCGHCLHG
jgi:hypothetical protein